MLYTLYRNESSDPKYNAQRNLDGRTHYVDDSTMRFHHSRILSSCVIANGLYFGLVESCALDMDNRTRGYRHVIFDIFGTIVTRCDLEDCVKKADTARTALYAARAAIEADMEKALADTMKAVEREKQSHARLMDYFCEDLARRFPNLKAGKP